MSGQRWGLSRLPVTPPEAQAKVSETEPPIIADTEDIQAKPTSGKVEFVYPAGYAIARLYLYTYVH
jgi:hypothetical protein